MTAMFKALGDPTRLRIFEFLRLCVADVSVEENGDVRPVTYGEVAGRLPTVGDVCCHITGEVGSNPGISFHLKELRTAGLIKMERRGKNMVCSLQPDAVKKLNGYFAQVVACENSCG